MTGDQQLQPVQPAPPLLYALAAVERETGLSRDTLRTWERRYGFPVPQRNRLGERQYPPDQVERLKAIRFLRDLGHRTSELMAMGTEELMRLHGEMRGSVEAGPPPLPAAVDHWLDKVRTLDRVSLQCALQRALMANGMQRFVVDEAAPLLTAVGEAWAVGALEIFQEHGFSQALTSTLRHAIEQTQGIGTADVPRVLLSTLPGEAHLLGLTMVEALLAVEGAYCESLGAQTPVSQIALAARARRADIVAVSCSACSDGLQLAADVRDLRALLPRPTELWVGGGATELRRRPVPGVRLFDKVDAVLPALHTWREVHVN